MRKRRTALSILAIATVLVTACQSGVVMFAACTPAADGNPTGTDGTYVLVCENGKWMPALTVDEFIRIRQGETVTVSPVPIQTFARAYTDLNDNDLYDSSTDVLIAELKDSNRDGVVSVGDSVVTNQYPITAKAPFFFGDFQAKKHSVAEALASNVGTLAISVKDAAGNTYIWVNNSPYETYAEHSPSELNATKITDSFRVSEPDEITAGPQSPSKGAVDIDADYPETFGRDTGFLNVTLTP